MLFTIEIVLRGEISLNKNWNSYEVNKYWQLYSIIKTKSKFSGYIRVITKNRPLHFLLQSIIEIVCLIYLITRIVRMRVKKFNTHKYLVHENHRKTFWKLKLYLWFVGDGDIERFNCMISIFLYILIMIFFNE